MLGVRFLLLVSQLLYQGHASQWTSSSDKVKVKDSGSGQDQPEDGAGLVSAFVGASGSIEMATGQADAPGDAIKQSKTNSLMRSERSEKGKDQVAVGETEPKEDDSLKHATSGSLTEIGIRHAEQQVHLKKDEKELKQQLKQLEQKTNGEFEDMLEKMDERSFASLREEVSESFKKSVPALSRSDAFKKAAPTLSEIGDSMTGGKLSDIKLAGMGAAFTITTKLIEGKGANTGGILVAQGFALAGSLATLANPVLGLAVGFLGSMIGMLMGGGSASAKFAEKILEQVGDIYD
eukprot:TRINITY_DN15191_c0_g2_i1.p1 TRINITY_DN15191_c0_g2~~TRINITY_DN15191_c0_g2_i1.p1  ORF type:complete len:292 (+),score=68.72 TRINITY_DN15191_c0_g2_i1:96-971(+)